MDGRNGNPRRKDEKRRQASGAGGEALRSRQKLFGAHISQKQYALVAATQGSSSPWIRCKDTGIWQRGKGRIVLLG